MPLAAPGPFPVLPARQFRAAPLPVSCTQARLQVSDLVLIFPWSFALVETHSLQTLHTVLSTGSPLKAQSYDYVYRCIKSSVLLGSISGTLPSVCLWGGGAGGVRTRDTTGPIAPQRARPLTHTPLCTSALLVPGSQVRESRRVGRC